MKCKFIVGLMGLLLACSAFGQAAGIYRNDGFVIVPPLIAPNIDATTFVNNGQFIINFTNSTVIVGRFTELGVQPDPYETQNTLNFTNLAGAFMSCNTGFRFDFAPPASQRQRASNFHNAGTINFATADTTPYVLAPPFFPYLTTPTAAPSNIFFPAIAGGKGSISADNLINPGVINLGFESVLRMRGSSIDLSYGTIAMQDLGTSLQGETLNTFFDGAIFDGYWGVGDVATQPLIFYPNGISPALFFESTPPFTPLHPVDQRNGATLIQQLVITNALTYLRDEIDATGTNRYVRCVFIGNTNQDIGVNVYFPGDANVLGIPDIMIEYTNLTSTASNNVYVFDYFGALTNFYLLPNGFAGNRGTAIPFNFLVFPSTPLPFLPPPEGATTIPPGTFNFS